MSNRLVSARSEQGATSVVPLSASPVWQEQGAGGNGHEFPLSYYWSLISRQIRRIATFVLFVTAAVTLLTLALPKQYEANVILRVDPAGAQQLGADQSQGTSSIDPALIVATEAKVVTSPSVVLRTIQDLGLANVPELAPKKPSGQAPRMDEVIRQVTSRISVTRPIGTLLLAISFRAHDPQLAAKVANGLASAFIEHEYSTRSKALTDSSKYMAGQIDNLRAQMERDETALVQYESTHDVIDPDDKSNIYQSRLNQINTDLSGAQSARMQIEAEYTVVKTGGLDALLTTPRGQSLMPLELRLQSDKRTLARMATIYGPRHPLYRQQKSLVDHDANVLRSQEQHVAQQLKSQYDAAIERERLIKSALDTEKKAMDAFNMRAIRYHALKAAADSSSRLYYDLQQRIQDATVNAGLRSEDLRVISPARIPEKPVYPRPLLAGFLSLLGSTLFGVAVALAVGLLDKSVTSPEQTELRFAVSTIGTLPLVSSKDDPEGLTLARYRNILPDIGAKQSENVPSRRSVYQEAILSLHTAILFKSADRLTVLAVTSSVPGEGKSTTSAHLAAAFSAMGQRTILIDADMRKPSAHRISGVSNRIGLSSVLRGQVRPLDAIIEMWPGFSILPAGPSVPNPSELLHLGLSEVIEDLKQKFDFVLIDCPPVLGFADAATVANMAESVVLVVSAGQTEQNNIAASIRQLRGVRANLLGIILNRVNARLDSYYQYYKTYYRSYYADDNEADDDID